MSPAILLALLFGTCSTLLQQQDAGTGEVRFHRVYLRNGNVIDGDLVKLQPGAVVLKLTTGEMIIRNDTIDRIEFIKMRDVKEKAQKVATSPKELPPATADSDRRESGARPRPSGAVSLFEADLETKRKADALLTKLAHANPEMKVEVMERLGELGGDAGPYLASLLDKIDRGDLSFVTAAIVKCKNSRAIPILAKVTESPEAIVRTAAASALGGLANDSVTPVLQPLLKDKDPTVRATAISSLKEVGDRRAFEAVLGVLADRDRQARAQAIQTSRELAEKLSLAAEFADALGRALESAPAPAQFDLMQALAQTKASEKWSLIAPFLRSEQPELREAAALALGKLGNPRAADDLAAQARTETEAQVKVQLAVAARLLAAKAAIDPLIRWLRDESASVRAESVVSLHELTAQRFGNDATKWEDWRAQNRDQ